MGISNTSRQKNLTGSEKENMPIKFQLNFFGLLKIIALKFLGFKLQILHDLIEKNIFLL